MIMIHIFSLGSLPVFQDIIADSLYSSCLETNTEYTFHRLLSCDELFRISKEKLISPSLVFIDVSISRKSAKDTSDKLRRLYPDCRLILLTNDEEDAFLAFEHRADMAVSKHELCSCPEKYLSRILPEIKAVQSDIITLEVYVSERRHEKMSFRLCDIVFLECVMKKACLTLRNSDTYRIKCAMWKELSHKFCTLPFAVPHNNYVVNLDFVQKVGTTSIKLKNYDKTIPLSKYRKKQFCSLLEAYRPIKIPVPAAENILIDIK